MSRTCVKDKQRTKWGQAGGNGQRANELKLSMIQ